MANNFTSLWGACFTMLGNLLNMKLPIYFGSTSLSTLDIILGTLGILASFAFVRALMKSGFSIAGKDIQSEYHHQKNINSLNNTERNRHFANSHLNNLERQDSFNSTFKRLGK